MIGKASPSGVVRSVPWELAAEADDGRTLTLRYVRFVRLRRPPPDPASTDRLPLRLRRTVKLDELAGVVIQETAGKIEITVRMKELRRNRPKRAMQAFAREGLVTLRLDEPRRGKQLLHGPVSRSAAADRGFLPVVRNNPKGSGP